jgi:hypothetical protein
MTIQLSASSALTLMFRVLMALSFVVALPGRGTAVQDPQAFIGYVGTQGMAAVGQNVSPAQRAERLRELFQRYFDVTGIAEFVLGRYRSSATRSSNRNTSGCTGTTPSTPMTHNSANMAQRRFASPAAGPVASRPSSLARSFVPAAVACRSIGTWPIAAGTTKSPI